MCVLHTATAAQVKDIEQTWQGSVSVNPPVPAPASWEDRGAGAQRLVAILAAKKNYEFLTEEPV